MAFQAVLLLILRHKITLAPRKVDIVQKSDILRAVEPGNVIFAKVVAPLEEKHVFAAGVGYVVHAEVPDMLINF